MYISPVTLKIIKISRNIVDVLESVSRMQFKSLIVKNFIYNEK